MNWDESEFHIRSIDLGSPGDVREVASFLAPLGFDFDPAGVQYTAVLETASGRIAATGSYDRDILKFVVVDPAHRETPVFARLVTHLNEKVLATGRNTVFVFTRPTTAPYFRGLGFTEIAQAPPLFALLEFGYRTLSDYRAYLRQNRVETRGERISAVVVNCNPFTNGHKYLMETAAAESDVLYVFVVEEDFSVFPFVERIELVRRGTAHMDNVRVLRGGRYVVSGATFPTYFLKSENPDLITRLQAELDVSVFARFLAPELGIRRRWVGSEPACPTTAAYNAAMLKILPGAGIEVQVIQRKSLGQTAEGPNFISASKVRRAIWEGKLHSVLGFLPDVTREFLESDRSLAIRERIRSSPHPL